MATNNSSHNINAFFSDNIINKSGDIHMSQCKDPNNDYLTITQEMFSSWLTKRTWSYCLIWNKLEGQAEDGPADHSSP